MQAQGRSCWPTGSCKVSRNPVSPPKEERICTPLEGCRSLDPPFGNNCTRLKRGTLVTLYCSLGDEHQVSVPVSVSATPPSEQQSFDAQKGPFKGHCAVGLTLKLVKHMGLMSSDEPPGISCFPSKRRMNEILHYP